MKIFGDGARLALAWKSQPIACTQLVKDYATSALGGMGTALNALAGAVGGSLGVKVSGEASASGLVTLDSRDLGAASVTMTSNDTCGVALF